ncbi:hypothetical protein GOODEAATRI_013067 [Goodea atripinnis]|uniref:Uncharacterized protein n=1 Tax=Goodea atripinnis TaxID=208336 RepID=A0ABV0N465_9TELE
MDSNFGAGMIMFSHLPPVTSFTRLSAHSVMQELPPQDLILKEERVSPDCSMGTQGGHLGGAVVGDYVHTMGIKQEKQSEHDYRLPLYPGGLGKSGEMMEGSYGITQGNVGSTGRKKGKSKGSAVGGERKKKKGDGAGVRELHMHRAVSGGYSIYEYSMESPTVSSSTEPGPSMQQGHQGQGPKMAFKKANRKSLNKAGLGHVKVGLLEQEGLGLMQSNEAKVESNSSNYDDAMQFVKKRRYLQAANNATSSGATVPGGACSEYDVSVHLSAQPSSLQGGISGVMDNDIPLNLEKSGITDEVLQSLLDHYTQKPDIHFDISDQHVDLSPASADGSDANAPSPSGDKPSVMQEYSRFLLQALERTSLSASFPLGPGLPSHSSGPFTSSHAGNPLYADKNIYSASHLECGFGQSVASPSLPSSVPKSHFAMLNCSSPQHSFNLSALEASSHQQLTPSQELTEQMEKQHSSTPRSSYQISPPDLSNQKDQSTVKNDSATVYPLVPSQDLASLDSSKPSYQIENFAQAFGSQFKPDVHGLSYSTDSSGQVDHRIRTPVSDFSGYSLLSDVSEPVSTGITQENVGNEQLSEDWELTFSEVCLR